MSGGPDAEQQAWPSLGTSSPDNGDYWILVTPGRRRASVTRIQ